MEAHLLQPLNHLFSARDAPGRRSPGDFRAGLESDHRATAGAGMFDCGCQNSRYPVTLDIVAQKSTRRRVEGVLFGVSIHCG
jgi:hypothetical protein